MTKRRNSETSDWSALVQEARDSFSTELVGLFFLLAGGVALFSLRGADVPWLSRMLGWTAPWFALTLIVLGVVLMLRRRAGYWSAEALVGAELTLLALMALTYINNNDVSGAAPLDGRDGGALGWVLGTILLDLFGWWPAWFLTFGLLLLGLYFLIRYTPLIYVVAYAGRLFPVVPAFFGALRDAMPLRASHTRGEVDDDGDVDELWTLPETANFVSAAQAEWDDPDPADGAPTQAKRKPKTSGSAAKPVRVRAPGELPPVDILQQDAGAYGSADVRAMQQLIESTLEDFSVPVRVVHVETGPTVTQFGVEPLYVERAGQKRKVRVSRIVSLADDLALALAAPAVRMEAPVPGRPYVGIEVPNTDKTLVGLRGIVESPAMQKEGGALALPLGRDTSGKPVVMDMTRAPHMLIAGQTGSGKSVCINTIITGLLMQHGPESLRFVMIDPKMVELPGYNGIPHLMGKVITDMDQVMGALTWLLIQMDDRYQMFREAGVRNIDAYNAKARRNKSMEHLPYIVLIVDELADLMMTAAEDVERQICRLAQMARATGIHLVLATQRPSTDVVTGLIKANFPTRIAFAVTSQIDSRVILDQPGAEKLLGRGDMLLMRPEVAKLFRVQGCFVGDGEIENIVHFWKQAETDADLPRVAPWNGLMARLDDEDELINEAIDVIRDMETCSASMLQRKLRIGYPKAARLIEDLEKRGVVGPDLGGGQGRPVLVKKEADEEDGEDGEEEYL